MERRTFLNIGAFGLGVPIAIGLPVSLQFFPKPSPEKWAVIFGSWYGTARDAAIWISEGMGGIASVLDVREGPDLSGFDHLVVGTAIQGGKGPAAFDAFLDSGGEKLRGKIRGLFAVCGNLGQPPGPAQTAEYIDGYLVKKLKTGPVPGRVFGGRITKRLMTETDYKLVADLYSKLKLPQLQDFDHLSRAACLAFGQEIRASLQKTLLPAVPAGGKG